MVARGWANLFHVVQDQARSYRAHFMIVLRLATKVPHNGTDRFLADRTVKGLSAHLADAMGQLRGTRLGQRWQHRNSRLNLQPPVRWYRHALAPRADGHEIL